MYNPNQIEASRDELRSAVLNAHPFKPLYVKMKVFYGCNLKCEICNHWHETRESPITVGEMREKKGLTSLLLAYTHISRVQPAALLIAGDERSGEDTRLFNELKSSIPNAQIVVIGYVSNQDLPSHYSIMDVLVHPSLQDGMPNAVLEAMAFGKTVIASRTGGVMDLLEDGKNGRTVSINDITFLSTVIQEILSDKPLRSRLGEAARRTILNKFTLQNELDGNLALYCELGLKT